MAANSALDNNSYGSVIVTNTSAVSGDFYAMTTVAATVVSAMTWEAGYDANSTDDWSDLTSIPAGVTLYGRFTSITLASGEVILHKSA